MNIFYVYEHWRPDHDECFYVGKGKGGRANEAEAREAQRRERRSAKAAQRYRLKKAAAL